MSANLLEARQEARDKERGLNDDVRPTSGGLWRVSIGEPARAPGFNSRKL